MRNNCHSFISGAGERERKDHFGLEFHQTGKREILGNVTVPFSPSGGLNCPRLADVTHVLPVRRLSCTPSVPKRKIPRVVSFKYVIGSLVEKVYL